MRVSGAVPEGLNGAVKALFPSVDVLPVGLIFDGSAKNCSVFVPASSQEKRNRPAFVSK